MGQAMEHSHQGVHAREQRQDFPSSIVAPDERGARNPVLMTAVGDVLHGVAITREDHELEQHILDCAALNERAYARFVAHQSPYDRDEAVEWMFKMYQAIGRRRPQVVRALHSVVSTRIERGRSA